MFIPSSTVAGTPLEIIAISVVVPPISTTRLLTSSVRLKPPITLAAGPQRIVSTG